MKQTDNIPLLTDIIQLGDEEMKNHFDGHVFDQDDIDTDIPAIQVNNEADIELDNLQIQPLNESAEDMLALPVEDTIAEDISIEENLSAELATEELPTETVDIKQSPADANETGIDIQQEIKFDTPSATEKTVLKSISEDELTDMIQLLVSDAVNATLPIIEAQLKQSISEQILQKLSRHLN